MEKKIQPKILYWGVPKPVSEKNRYDLWWNERRKQNRLHNLELAHNVRVRGTIFYGGVGQPKKK